MQAWLKWQPDLSGARGSRTHHARVAIGSVAGRRLSHIPCGRSRSRVPFRDQGRRQDGRREQATGSRRNRLHSRRDQRAWWPILAIVRGARSLRTHRQLLRASQRSPRFDAAGCHPVVSGSPGARVRRESNTRCQLPGISTEIAGDGSIAAAEGMMILGAFTTVLDQRAFIAEAALRHRLRPAFAALAAFLVGVTRRSRRAHSGRPHQVGEDRHRRARAAQSHRSRTETRLRWF